MLVFDIETGPLPEAILRELLPECQLPPHPGEFDPDAVKLGNTKDEVKIAEKIEAAKKKHAAEVAGYEKDCQQKQTEHWEGFVDKAALNAGTGQVLAIGYYKAPGFLRIGTNDTCDEDGERKLLAEFWEMVQNVGFDKGHKIPGHNIHGFDLPFLMQRSWLLNVPVLDGLLVNGRYWHDCFVDTMKVWSCGSFGKFVKLDDICRYLGVPGKNGSGAEFANLFKTDRQTAIDYLKNDLEMTWNVAERLGVR